MPAKPRWLLNLPKVIEQLYELQVPVIDRNMCERLFGVRRRRAIELMRNFGGYRTGNSFLVGRLDLVNGLQRISEGGDYQAEHERKQRLSVALDGLSRHRTAARVQISVSADVHGRRIHELPSDVELGAGHLMVQFTGAEDLLTKLYELAQTIANDYELFCRRVNPERTRLDSQNDLGPKDCTVEHTR